MPLLSSLGQLAFIHYFSKKSVDNAEIAHKQNMLILSKPFKQTNKQKQLVSGLQNTLWRL